MSRTPTKLEAVAELTTEPNPGSPAMATVEGALHVEGIDLPERYRLRARIGVGGFGEVWAATDGLTARRAAVKIVRAGKRIGGAALRQLEIEVRAAARLQHPNIAAVYDVATGDDYAYLVMELAPGCDLRHLAAQGPLPPEVVYDVSMGVLAGLAYAHARGVIHRDLKPDNVVVHSRGLRWVPRIVDFGVACLLDDQVGSVRMADEVIGTPLYMAPEQIAGRVLDLGPATDLYAFGVMLYEMVAGHPPFDDTDMTRLLQKHLIQKPPPLPRGSLAPAGLDAVLARLLAKTPVERYELAADVVAALGELPWHELTGELPTVTEEPIPRSRPISGIERRRSGPVSLASTPPPPPTEHRSGIGLFGMRSPPLVGREDEQQRLWTLALQALRTSTARAVVLEGEAGIGKSRLVSWLKRELEETGAMTAWCVVHQPDGEGGGLAQAIERGLRLSGATEEQARARLEALLAHQGESTRELAATVAALIRRGAAAAGGAQRAHAAAIELLTLRAQSRGLLLWIEDAQWASSGEGLRLVDQLLERQREAPCPLLVIATLRTESGRRSTRVGAELDLLARRSELVHLTLGRLADEAIERLLGSMIEVDVPVRRMIAERSGGNPLFAIQLLGHCLESGAITSTAGGLAALRDEDAELEMPGNIQELCLARVRALARRSSEHADAVHIAEIAALDGERVPLGVLERVVADPERLHRARRVLIEEGVWTAASSDEIAFEHRLLRDCLVQLRPMPEERNKELHAAFAEAWKAWGLARDSDVREACARHYEAAGQLRSALELAMGAAALRLDEGQFGRAASLYRRVLALSKRVPDAAASAGDAQLGLGQALEGTGALAEAAQVLASACLHLEGHGDDAKAALARAHLGWVEIWRANYELARAHLERAEERLLALGDELAVAYCLRGRCWVAFQTGDLEGCEALNGEALAIYDRHESVAGRCWCLKNLAAVRLQQTRQAEARALAEQALEQFRAIHDHNGIASVLSDLGEQALARGDVLEAVEHFDAMRREALLARNDNHRRAALARLAACELSRANVDAATEMLDELALCLSPETSHWIMPTLQALRGWAHAQAGRHEAAREALELVGTPPEDDPLRREALARARELLKKTS